MARFSAYPAALFLALSVVAGFASGASAQSTRTWVSGGEDGDDANPCSRTAPCKTFAGAIAKTAVDGVIDVLSPGGFGTVAITKGVTIRATGADGAITASATNGVSIDAPGARVNLIGIQIEGAASGLTGVRVQNAASVLIDDCLITGFRGATAGVGVSVASPSAVKVTINAARITSNLVGVDIDAPADRVNQVTLNNVLLDGNAVANIRADGAKSRAFINRSAVINGPIAATRSADVLSYGNNVFTGSGGPTGSAKLE